MLEALWIVLLGMGLVFAVLAVLLLVTAVVNKLVQLKQRRKSEQ